MPGPESPRRTSNFNVEDLGRGLISLGGLCGWPFSTLKLGTVGDNNDLLQVFQVVEGADGQQ